MIGIWLLVVGDSPEGALVRSGHEWEVAPRNIQLERSYFYDEADFRIGGKDVFRCGPQGDPKFRGETRCLLIVPNARVVSSETLDMDGKPLAVSLATLDFEPAEGASKVTVTVQIVSFVGPDMIRGYESGNRSALENLTQHLANIPNPPSRVAGSQACD